MKKIKPKEIKTRMNKKAFNKLKIEEGQRYEYEHNIKYINNLLKDLISGDEIKAAKAMKQISNMKFKDKNLENFVIRMLIKHQENVFTPLRTLSFEALMHLGDIGYVLSAAINGDEFRDLIYGDYEKAINIAKNMNKEDKKRLMEFLLSDQFINNQILDFQQSVIEFLREAELFKEMDADKAIKLLLKKFDESWVKGEVVKTLMDFNDVTYVVSSLLNPGLFVEHNGKYKKAISILEQMSEEEQKEVINILEEKGLVFENKKDMIERMKEYKNIYWLSQ